MAWLMRRVKWALWLMVASPILALGFLGAEAFYFYPQKRAVFDTGVEATALVEGGTRTKRRRSGTSFSLDLSWKDKAGAARTEKVSVSKALADKLIRDDMLVVDQSKIKYLEADASAPVLVLADMPAAGPVAPDSPAMAMALLPFALIGGDILYFLRRREQRQSLEV